MKKRILSCLMALALCLTLLPTAALADEPAGPANGEPKQEQENQQEQPTEEETISPMPLGTPAPAAEGMESSTPHEHCLCGAAHKNIGDQHTEEESTTFTAWTNDRAKEQYNNEKKTASNSLPKTGGSYYLTEDVTLTATWSPADGTTLCLNGYSIISKSNNYGIKIDGGVAFTLCDCNGSKNTYRFEEDTYKLWKLDKSGSHEVTGGILTSGGSGVFINNGTFNMYGGTIVGNRGNSNKGGGVFINFNGSNNKFNMYGGAIVGNSVSGDSTTDGGGGVYVGGNSNTFNMYGGEISGNATTKHASGGGVNVNDKGTFNMTGGVIGGEGKGNTSSWGGGGVYIDEQCVFTMSGSARITDNKETYGAGGGVQVSGGTFTMSGDAEIVNNQTTGTNGSGGGGVSVSKNSAFTMSGNAAITGNSSRGNGGGVSVRGNTLIVSGNVRITGNTKGNEANNVYLGQYNDDPMPIITIAKGGLTEGAKIGVTPQTSPAADSPVTFAKGMTGYTVNSTDAKAFFADAGTDYKAQLNGTDIRLTAGHADHPICGATCPGHTVDGENVTHKSVEWKAVSKPADIKTAGRYYLTQNADDVDWTVPAGGVTLDLNGHSIKRKFNSTEAITVNSGITFTLTDCKGTGSITCVSGATGRGVYVNGGTFNMYGGEITGNNMASNSEVATEMPYGGGVYVGSGGTFNLHSGKITNNTATNGGGVDIGFGTFNMYGGEITGNKAAKGGGVYVAGSSTVNTFNMYGGTISGNTAQDDEDTQNDGAGGGVYIESGSAFTMTGGTIGGTGTGEANTATSGGGVYMDGGKFTMSGGSISGNSGCGVYVESGTFTMSDSASITGNSGGVNVRTNGKFVMSGGSIANNMVTGNGGGVYVIGTFEMSGGSITDNTASGTGCGGGVDAASGTFTMSGGSIANNTANISGGGVIIELGTFNMSDSASITNNTAIESGGGVFAREGAFNMSGGSITDNKATSQGGGVYVWNAFTVSGNVNITDNKVGNADNNVYLHAKKTITIGEGELSGKIGVTKQNPTVGSVIATGATGVNLNSEDAKKFKSDDSKYVVKYENKQLVLAEAEAQPPAGEHKHCLCGKTHKEVGDHKNDTQTTFATKLWMDNGELKKGNNVWTKGTVNRADGGAVSHEGYVLTTGSYYLENDLTLSGAAILIDGDVKLCLNGHTIDRANGNAALDYVIWVLGRNDAHLTLTDCVGDGKLTGGGNGGVDIFGFCTLDMFGGTITGNTNSGVDVGQYGTFNLYGGKITGNRAGYGGGVYTYGKFTMSGGSITNNTATEKGGGVLVGGGTFIVSGNVNITNNKVGETDNNVYLSTANETVIGVTGALTGGARIGVTPATWPDGNGQVAIASGVSAATGGTHYDMTRDDMKCFQSDNVEYQISLGSNVALLAKKGGETPEIVPVSGVALNKTSTSISVGNSEKLTATVEPSDATNKSVTWTSSDTSVATVAVDGTVTAKAPGIAEITATAADGSGKSATCTVTVTGGTTPSQPSNPGGSTGGNTGGSTGGSSSDRDSSDSNPIIKTETKNNADGSTTKTETRRDGSVTQTTTGKDGGVSKTETKKDGSSVTENKSADGSTGTIKTDKNGQTEAKTALSNKAIEDAKKSGEPVKAPVEVEASRNSNTAPTVKVELPKNAGETEVEIPVSNAKPGTVAVLVHPDGTEEIVKNSVPTEDGIRLTVDGNATVKIVDNSKDFIDIRNHWAEDEIDFVSARELVNGVSDTIYAPNASATRAQLWTILARQNDADLSGGANWYEKAQLWSKDKGISDGTNPNGTINRAQMVTMLWRTMGQPAAASGASFADVPADSYYAQAVSWAVENGITTGVGNGRFDPAGACTRAQIAAFLTRLYAEN